MRILVLGGTGLTGSAIVTEAVEQGHTVVSVHRGRSRGHPGAEQVVLDRRVDGHEALAAQEWDAVIDVSGYVPAVVRDALTRLGSPTTRWVFVSSTSVYADRTRSGQREDSPLRVLDGDVRESAMFDPRFDWRSRGLYGECKVLCEHEVLATPLASATILRPCVIAGAHDSTWRFPYWVERAGRGGHIVAPAPPDAPVAVIDARDLASFALRCVEHELTDTFLLAPDPRVSTMGALLDAVRAAWPAVDSEVVWVDPELLREHAVEPWAGLPFWLPPWTDAHGFNEFDASKARGAGFAMRPLAETAQSVRRWLEDCGERTSRDCTLTPEAEAELVNLVLSARGTSE